MPTDQLLVGAPWREGYRWDQRAYWPLSLRCQSMATRGLAPVTAGAELTGRQHDLERDHRLDVQAREALLRLGVA
jgi:hypothetical protein